MGRDRNRSRARNGGGVSVPWYEQGDYGGYAPSIWLDFANDRYAVNGELTTLADVATLTRTTTANAFNSFGAYTSVSSGTPRLEYDPVTLRRLGFLAEDQRTNLFLNSATGATQGVTVTAQAYTVSFYGTGTITFSGAYVGSLVGSGAYPTRSTITFTPSAGTVTCTVSGTVQYVNFEAGSFATSWITTTGTSAARNSDLLKFTSSNTIPFASWFPAGGEYTVVVKYIGRTLVGNKNVVSISDGTNSNRLLVRPIFTGALGGSAFISSGGVTQYTETGIGIETLDVSNYAAIGVKANDIQYYCNGEPGVPDTSATLPVSPSQMNIGSGPANNELMNGIIQEVRVYPSRLSNIDTARLSSANNRAYWFFGDSITVEYNASIKQYRYASRYCLANGISQLNAGISSTPLQNTAVIATGLPFVNNGRDRYSATLTGSNKADGVVIVYGVNDIRNQRTETNYTAALYGNDLGEVVAGLLAAGYSPSSIIIGSPPYFINGDTPSWHSDYRDACQAVALAYGCKYADVYQYMLDNGSTALISPDDLHPNDTGHTAISTSLTSAVIPT